MKVIFTEPFQNNYKFLPRRIETKFEKQVLFLSKDLRYPSLRSKKFDEVNNVWQARANGKYRFYFQIHKDTYYILNIINHRD